MTEPGRAVHGRPASASLALMGTVFRPARPDDLARCGRIWRESINDYLRPLNQAPIPDELAGIGRLHAHTLATDPERFVVATRAGREPGEGDPTDVADHVDGALEDEDVQASERIVGFGSAVVRGDPVAAADGGRDRAVWYLSMLFVRPGAQGEGLGRAILERLLPPPSFPGPLAVAVDSLQPISTALYARYGMLPRTPILDLSGSVERPEAFPALPSGVRPTPFEEIAAGPPDGPGHRALTAAVGELDREVLGFERPADHRFVRLEGRRGFLYRGPDGSPLGYGYAGALGRVGPIAVSDPDLLDAVVGHLIATVPARGATAIWASGGARRLAGTLLAAGLRLDSFPLLLGWDRPYADLDRYLSISPGLP